MNDVFRMKQVLAIIINIIETDSNNSQLKHYIAMKVFLENKLKEEAYERRKQA